MAQATTGVIEAVDVLTYKVPTATDHESDGTLVWDATEIVVVQVHADGEIGTGYTYCHPAAAAVIDGKLASIVRGADAMMPERCWAQMQVELRQLGHAGIAMMALSAVDVALWDLKARMLGVCLADALPRFHESVVAYGSGGFTSYSGDELREQVSGWANDGFGAVKIKIGRDKTADPQRVELVREVVGADVEVMVDANGAYTRPEALLWSQVFSEQGVTYLEEPVSSQDLAGLAEIRSRVPAGIAIAAGEYGWNMPYFRRMLAAPAVDILQADVTRCGGITNMLRVDGLCKAHNAPSSAHCAPAISAHACCAMETMLNVEYFFDHYRIEGMLFDGTVTPHDGLLTPDRSRPGLGLELKRADAERYEVSSSRAG